MSIGDGADNAPAGQESPSQLRCQPPLTRGPLGGRIATALPVVASHDRRFGRRNMESSAAACRRRILRGGIKIRQVPGRRYLPCLLPWRAANPWRRMRQGYYTEFDGICQEARQKEAGTAIKLCLRCARIYIPYRSAREL